MWMLDYAISVSALSSANDANDSAEKNKRKNASLKKEIEKLYEIVGALTRIIQKHFPDDFPTEK